MRETLYSLAQDYKSLLDLAGSAEPDEIEMFNDTLEAVLGQIEVKADGYAAVMSEIEGRANIVAKEIDRLKAIEDRLVATHKHMKDALQNTMIEIGKSEIKTDLHRFKLVNNGGLQPLKITSVVPDEYTKKEVIIKPDNDKIRQAIKDGQELDFARLEERGKHLKID